MTNLTKLKEEGDREFDNKFVVDMSKDEHPYVAFYDRDTKQTEYWNSYKIKDHIHQREDKAYQLGQQDMLERVRGVVPNEKELIIAKNPQDPITNSNRIGFNLCREETLKALDNLT
jgi:hypothetical protein